MKSYDIYNLWVIFDKAMADPAFSNEQKVALGTDMLNALPPEMLCSSSKPSLAVVKEAMEGRLNEYTRSTRKTGLRAGTSPMAGSEGIHAEENAGDGVSVEGVATSEKPAKQARKAKG